MKKIVVFTLLAFSCLLLAADDSPIPFKTMDNAVQNILYNANGALYAINHGDTISVFDVHNNMVSSINCSANAFCWLGDDTLAIAVESSIFIYSNVGANPVRSGTIRADDRVTALASSGWKLFYGTVTGGIYSVNVSNRSYAPSNPELIGYAKTEIAILCPNGYALLVVPKNDHPRVYRLENGILEAMLVQENYSQITAAEIRPNTNQINVANAAGEILEFTLSSGYAVRRPEKTIKLDQPVYSLSWDRAGRYLAAGLNAKFAIIDHNKKDDEAGYISNFTGYIGGSVNALSRSPATGSYIIASGKNLFEQRGVDAGTLHIRCASNSSASANFTLAYTANNRIEKATASFYNGGYYEWRVPAGEAAFSVAGGSYEYSGESNITVSAGSITEILIHVRQIPPEEIPEAPLAATPPVAIIASGGNVIAAHQNFLSFWIKTSNNCVFVPTAGTPHLLAGNNGMIAAAFGQAVSVYNSRGNRQYTVELPVKADSMAVANNTLAVGIGNELTVFNGGILSFRMPVELSIKHLAISADAKTVLVLTERSLSRVDLDTMQKQSLPLNRPAPYKYAAYSERYIAVLFEDGLLQLVDNSSASVVREYQATNAISVEFQGEEIVYATENSVKFLNRVTGSITSDIPLPGRRHALISSQNIAVIDNAIVKIYSGRSETGQLVTDGTNWWFRNSVNGSYTTRSNTGGQAALPF